MLGSCQFDDIPLMELLTSLHIIGVPELLPVIDDLPDNAGEVAFGVEGNAP